MAHESGSVNSSRDALIEVRLISGEAIECVVDTGFDGGLMLPRAFAEHIQIPIMGRLAFEMVGGLNCLRGSDLPAFSGSIR